MLYIRTLKKTLYTYKNYIYILRSNLTHPHPRCHPHHLHYLRLHQNQLSAFSVTGQRKVHSEVYAGTNKQTQTQSQDQIHPR